MAIYSSRFLESAIEDSFNTPDDVGIDLKQVEEDIAGPGGIAAHEPEIDDAAEGVVGDPLEEAYQIMFESEYNYNQILEAAGIYELNTAASGREVVYEAEAKESFFEKVKRLFLNMFKSITEAFKKFLDSLHNAVNIGKKFAIKYSKEIKEGEKAAQSLDADKWPKGFKYADEIKFNNTATDRHGKLLNMFNKDFDDYNEMRINGAENIDEKYNSETGDEMDKNAIRELTGIPDVDNMSDLGKALLKRLRGAMDQPTSLKGEYSADDVIDILKGDREIAGVKDEYNKIKKSYESAISTIEKIKKIADGKSSKKYYKDSPYLMTICNFFISRMRFEQNVTNTKFHAYCKAAKEKRSQALRVANFFRSNYSKPKKTSVKESTFFDVNLI